MGGYVVPWIEALGIVVVLWGVLEAFMGSGSARPAADLFVRAGNSGREYTGGIEEAPFRERLRQLSGG